MSARPKPRCDKCAKLDGFRAAHVARHPELDYGEPRPVTTAKYRVRRHGPFEDPRDLCQKHFTELLHDAGTGESWTYNITRLR